MQCHRCDGDAGLAAIWGTQHAVQRSWPLRQQARTVFNAPGIEGMGNMYMQGRRCHPAGVTDITGAAIMAAWAY